MVNNRKMRRAEAATATTTDGNGHNQPVKLTPSQQKKIATSNAEVMAVARRIAVLAIEQENMRVLFRQKQAQLEQACTNALREHGIDLDDPEQSRWRINPETMEVQKMTAPTGVELSQVMR